MKKFKNILFDWDGTLSHSLPIWLDAYKKIFVDKKITITDEEIFNNIFPYPDKAVDYGVTNMEEFYKLLTESVGDLLPASPLHDEVEETIKSLHTQGIKLGIVTSNYKKFVHKALSLHDLHSYFDAVITGDDVEKFKPDAEPVLKALEKMQAKENETLFIGDSEVDIGAGKAAGVSTAIHYPEINKIYYKEKFIKGLKPDYIIAHFSDLLTIV